ncbi:MAG: class I SAM-dependent methyltransferase [Coriobacteriales bacterium]
MSTDEEVTAAVAAAEATLAYYAANAEAFASSTASVEFSAVQARFEALLEPGARVLDFGCGSGRDAKRFLEAGFAVDAVDGSPELCRIASQLTGLPVRCMRFEELDAVGEYDGIWACSSILHVPSAQLPALLGKMAAALRDGGVVYTSFKHGEGEGMRHGRYFSDFTEETFAQLIAGVPTLHVEEQWVSSDVRPGRQDEKWLNVILRKA